MVVSPLSTLIYVEVLYVLGLSNERCVRKNPSMNSRTTLFYSQWQFLLFYALGSLWPWLNPFITTFQWYSVERSLDLTLVNSDLCSSDFRGKPSFLCNSWILLYSTITNYYVPFLSINLWVLFVLVSSSLYISIMDTLMSVVSCYKYISNVIFVPNNGQNLIWTFIS